MAIYDDVVGLENFIQRVIHIAQCLTACNLEVTAASPLPTSPPSPEPMQIDSYHHTSSSPMPSSEYPAIATCDCSNYYALPCG